MKLAVIGAGQMGTGIAQVAAVHGHELQMIDMKLAAAARAKSRIEARLARQVCSGNLTREAARDAVDRIAIVEAFFELQGAELVIEAIPEDRTRKTEVVGALDAVLPEQAIIASNTSSISITALAAATHRPDRVIGMHFMNPVPVMRLVEIVRGLQTSDETYRATLALAAALGKTAVPAREAPGFIVNRILIPMLNEAVFVLEAGLASCEDIDRALMLGTNQPLGPLSLADMIGLDTVLAICESLHAELGDDKYRPAPLLRRYVAASWLGRKSGRGFYVYEPSAGA